MPPLIKFWRCKFKDGHSVDSPGFRQLLIDIFDLTKSYTNPEYGAPPMHAMYQDTRNPSQLLMITGYPSQELNTEADTVYAQKYLPRMFEYVQHVWLKQLHLDIAQVQLEDYALVAIGENPTGWVGESGIGGWDIWPQTQQGLNMPDLQKQESGIWVHVSGWNGLDNASSDSASVEKLYLRKIESR